jgi:hypothetical protein
MNNGKLKKPLSIYFFDPKGKEVFLHFESLWKVKKALGQQLL